MNHCNPYHLRSPSRRRVLLQQSGGGFLGVALGAMLARGGRDPDAACGPHFTPKAKSVIFLFMCGGVSHIDTFDPKDNQLGRHADRRHRLRRQPGRDEPARDSVPAHVHALWQVRHSGVRLVSARRRRHRRDRRGAVDVVQRSNHFPAAIECFTGHHGRPFDHPTLGSWVSHALGSANENLPTFVNIGRPSSPVQLTGGYLGATVAATPFQPGAEPIPNLNPPDGGDRQRCRARSADAGACTI